VGLRGAGNEVIDKVCDKVEGGYPLRVKHPSHRPKPHKHWQFITFYPSQQPSQSVPASVPETVGLEQKQTKLRKKFAGGELGGGAEDGEADQEAEAEEDQNHRKL
jgi:hypothetical protein